MKNNHFTRILGVLCTLIISCSFFVACGEDKDPQESETVYYTVSFDLDGGEIADKEVSGGVRVAEGTALNLKEYTPAKDNNTFGGWEAQNALYSSEYTLYVNSNVALKAKWQPIVLPPETVYYTVTFDLDGGEIADKDVSGGVRVEEGTALNLSEYTPAKEGYLFNGWKADDADYSVEDALTVNGNTALQAQWKRIDQLAEELKYSLSVYLSSLSFENTFLTAKTTQARLPLMYLRYIDKNFYSYEMVGQLKGYLNMIEEICENGELKDSLYSGSSVSATGWYGLADYLYSWSLIYNQYQQWCADTGNIDTTYNIYFNAIANYIKKLDQFQSESQKVYIFQGAEVTQANLYYKGYNALNNISSASFRMTYEQFEELLTLVAQATGNTDGHKEFLDYYKNFSNYDSMTSAEKTAFKLQAISLWKNCLPVTQVAFGYAITNVLPLIEYNLGLSGLTPYCDSVMLSYYAVDETGAFLKQGTTPNWIGFSGRPVAASLYRDREEYSVAWEKTMQGYFPFTNGWSQPLDEMINLDRLCNYYNHTLGSAANVAPQFALLTGMMHGIDMEHYIKEVYTDLDSEVGQEYNIITLWRENLQQDDAGHYIIKNTTDMAVAIAYCAMVEGIEAPTPLGLYSRDVAVIKLPEVPVTVEGLTITASAKKTFENGEEFSSEGLKVSALLSDGRQRELAPDEYTVICEDYDAETAGTYTATITYLADESKTVSYTVKVNEKPLTIQTTLEDGKTYTGSKLIFDVFARDGYGNKVTSSVTLNGENVDVNWDDTEKTSFTLNFTQSENVVVITATSGTQTATMTYNVIYEKGPTTFTFAVEAFTIGCGYVIDPVQIVVDENFVAEMVEYFGYENCDVATFEEQYLNAAHVLLYTLNEYGYEGNYTGSPSSGFYLSMITGFEHSNNVPAELLTELESNGFSVDDAPNSNTELGEFDYTHGSGWMYSVNGVFPNVGFADYYIQDGDVMRVQFTLAYGADIGGSSSLGGGGDSYFENVNKERDALTETMAQALAQDKGETEEYLTAFELIQKFGVTAEELTAAQQALEAVLG